MNTLVRLTQIRAAVAAERFEEALDGIDSIIDTIGAWPELLVMKARLIQLSSHDGPTLEDAEACLLRAIEDKPTCAEAIQDLAHFYAVVVPRPEEARRFADLYADLTARALAEIRTILA